MPLTDLTPGTVVDGLIPGRPVTIIGVTPHGAATLTIPNLAVNDYYVVVRADPGNGYYTAAPSVMTPLTVYQPVSKSATGGGWIWDGGQHANFGFSVRYKKSGMGVQGNSLFVFRDGFLYYIVKSNAWTGLAFSSTNKAFFQGKANVNTYDPDTGVTTDIGGNFSFIASVVDNGGSGDTYRMTVSDKDRLLYHDTGPTVLSGGNIVVRTR